MKQILKQLRKCEDLNLLVVSHDENFIDDVSNLFCNSNKLITTSSNSESLKLCNDIDFDVVIIDTRSDDFVALLDKIKLLKLSALKIIILDTNNDEDVISAINSDVYTILAKPFDIINLKLSIIMSLNQTQRKDKIKLGQGFYFDKYRDRVYNKNSKVIELTKLELGLLKLIIENKDNVVDYETIEKQVWKGKKMSIFTMRNVVNKIRTKLYYEVFENASSKGYILH